MQIKLLKKISYSIIENKAEDLLFKCQVGIVHPRHGDKQLRF